MNNDFPCATDKIRAVADRTSPLTNPQIKDSVLRRFGVEVTTCQIINSIGAYHKRIKSNPDHIENLKQLAKKYVTTVGDRALARELVGTVQL